jgi:GxxExxY protein
MADRDDLCYVDDDESGVDPRLNEITNRVIGAAIAVHKVLLAGYTEGFYERAMEAEMKSRGIRYERQKPFEVFYKGHCIGEGRIDFLVEDEVVVELKAVDSINPVHIAQVMSYMKATGKRLALIINFNVKRLVDGIRRVAL